MSKFLNLVEDHRPEKDIDELTDAKRSLQRLLLKSKIEAHGVAFQDILRVRLDDGRVVELEVKDVVVHEEDQEIKTGPEKYDVDKEVNRLANQGGMFSGAGKAKKALKQRQKVAKDAIAVYDKKTKELQTAVRDAANPPKTP